MDVEPLGAPDLGAAGIHIAVRLYLNRSPKVNLDNLLDISFRVRYDDVIHIRDPLVLTIIDVPPIPTVVGKLV